MTPTLKLWTYSSWDKVILWTMICVAMTIVFPTSVLSSGFQSPEECLAYADSAHLNCLYAYIEIQQDTIAKLETRITEEQRNAQQLQEHVTRQRSVNDELEQRIQDHNNVRNAYRVPRIRGYSGFSYGFGRPRYYRRFFTLPLVSLWGTMTLIGSRHDRIHLTKTRNTFHPRTLWQLIVSMCTPPHHRISLIIPSSEGGLSHA